MSRAPATITGSSKWYRVHRLVPYAVYAAAVVYFATKSMYSLYDFPLDDAWIHRVYSRSFAYAHGFQYNPGVQEAGSTSPLWAITTAPAHWLEPFGPNAVVLAVKAIEIVLGALLLGTIQGIGRDVMGTAVGGSIAATMIAVEPRFLFSVLSGMENILLLLLWVHGSRTFATRKHRQSLACLGLAAVTRPEALILLPLWLIGRWLLDLRSASLRWTTAPLLNRRRWPTIAEHGAWLAAYIPAVLWGLFCRFANGHWLPTTFYLKSRPFRFGWLELWLTKEIVTQHGYASLTIFGVGIAVLIVWTVARLRVEALALLWLLVLAPLAYAAGVAGSRVLDFTGYYWTRWLDPPALALTIAFCLGCGIGAVELSRVVPVIRQRSRAGPWRVAGAGVVALVWVALLTPGFAASFMERRDRLASDSRAIHLINVRTGEWIRDHTPAEARIGVNDAGAIRYFGQRWTLDLIGLNNASVAFKRRRVEPNDMDWLAIFPSWFPGSPLLPLFALRQVFQIPVAEYTICPCPGQSLIAIFERIPQSAS